MIANLKRYAMRDKKLKEPAQTAVEWLFNRLSMDLNTYQKAEALEQAKQIEKEQIADAWDDGDYAYFYSKETGRDFYNGEEYYNDKYGKSNP